MAIANVADRAAAYGIPGVIVDGSDVLAVHGAVAEAVQRARGGEGPMLLECLTHRRSGNYEGDAQSYRDALADEEWQRRDPIVRLAISRDRRRLARRADGERDRGARAGPRGGRGPVRPRQPVPRFGRRIGPQLPLFLNG